MGTSCVQSTILELYPAGQSLETESQPFAELRGLGGTQV